MSKILGEGPTSGGNNTGSYTYDQLGRQTHIPSVDAPNQDWGDLELSYYDTDAIKSIAQDSTTTTFTLDGAGRRLTQTVNDWDGTATTTRHYTDAGDNPTWTEQTTGTGAVTTRYTGGLGGDLGLTLTTQGGSTTAQLAVTTNRGDASATIAIPDTGTAYPDSGFFLYNEYGDLRNGYDPTPGSIYDIGYGWLGAKQRATLNNGLTLMGARLYNQATGSFTSSDPIYGGGPTTFAYPYDPINSNDLSGKRTKYTKNENGTRVPVRSNVRAKLLKKHGLKWKTVKKMMPKLGYSHSEGDDLIYRGVAIEVKCSIFRGCWNTGNWVVVKAIVNFRRGSDRKTIGMKSMYCEGMRVCPRWINKKIWN